MSNRVTKNDNTSRQLPADQFGPLMVESQLPKLIDVWGRLLTAAEFKIAACIYRAIDRNGGRAVRISGQELAKAAGVGARSVDTARKTLAGKGVIRMDITPKGTWFGFPEAATSGTSGPECVVTDTATESAPAPATAQDGGPAAIAELDIPASAAAPNAETSVPVGPGLRPPEVAAETPAREAAPVPAFGASAAGISLTTAEASVISADPDVDPQPRVPDDLGLADAPNAHHAESPAPAGHRSQPPGVAAEIAPLEVVPGSATGAPPVGIVTATVGSASMAEPVVASAMRAGDPQPRLSAGAASAIGAGTVIPAARAAQRAIVLPEAQPETAPAAMAPAAPIIAILKKLQYQVLQTLLNRTVAPELAVAVPQERRSAGTAPAISAEAPAPTMSSPATGAPAAHTLSSLPAGGGAITAGPELISQADGRSPQPPAHANSRWPEAGGPGSSPRPAHPPATTPVNFEDTLTAAVQVLLAGHCPDPDYTRHLRDSVPDQQRLLAGLEWLLARGECFADGNLLYSRIQYLCWQRDGPWPSPLL